MNYHNMFRLAYLNSGKNSVGVAKEIGTTPLAVRHWMKGENMPKAGEAKEIDDFIMKYVGEEALQEKHAPIDVLVKNPLNFENVVILRIERFEALKDDLALLASRIEKYKNDLKIKDQEIKEMKLRILASGIFDVTSTFPNEPVRFMQHYLDFFKLVGITQEECDWYLTEYMKAKNA